MLKELSKAFASIHIGGTNGKGSVSTKMARVLHANGYRVGLFTSPHISSKCERIEINGQLIAEARLEDLLTWVRTKGAFTFFEELTAAAFLYFGEEKVDIAVIEVGMGGRLDATNVITPILAVITSIGLDHTRYLGNTLEKIAQEKAGILKEGIPYILGPTAGRFIEGETVRGPFADFEEENQAIARAALLKLPFSLSLERGLEAIPPCRFEEINGVLLDVAHNPPALEALFARIKKRYPGKGVSALATFSKDKEIVPSIEILRRETRALFLTEIDETRLAQDFERARTEAERSGDLFLCTGTFYIMDWIRRRLGAK